MQPPFPPDSPFPTPPDATPPSAQPPSGDEAARSALSPQTSSNEIASGESTHNIADAQFVAAQNADAQSAAHENVARATLPVVQFEPVRIAPPPGAASLSAPPVVETGAATGIGAPILPSPTLPNRPSSITDTPSASSAAPNTLGTLNTLLLGGLLACVLVGLGMLIGRGGATSSTGNGVAAPINIATVDLTSQSAIESAIQRVGPAVMNVDTTFGGGGSKEFLPDPGTSSRPVQGKGTGFVIDSKRGLMLTNAHVVADAQKIQVTTRDGKKYTGKILGVDRQSDIAVVVIDNKTLPEAKLAPMKNAHDIKIGQWSIAIGNPFAQANTVTVGVISATGRTIPVPDEKNGGTFQLTDMLQTDAAINPGNSGGPLCNINGEVVGINTAIYGIGTGLGFSIPINKAYAVAQEIIKHGSVQRAYVGLQLQAITKATQQEYGLKDTLGALVQNAVAGSPAAKSGFQAGDIIRRINGQNIKDMAQAQATIQKQKVGATLKIEVLRNNTQKTLTLKTVPQTGA